MIYRKKITQPETAWFGPSEAVVEVDDSGDISLKVEVDCDWLRIWVDKKHARKLAITLLKAADKA